MEENLRGQIAALTDRNSELIGTVASLNDEVGRKNAFGGFQQ